MFNKLYLIFNLNKMLCLYLEINTLIVMKSHPKARIPLLLYNDLFFFC